MIFTPSEYYLLSELVFQDWYPGYRKNVVESPNGDGNWDTEKRYAHVAHKYLKKKWRGNYSASEELMLEYLRTVEADGLDAVNQTIGKEVKAAYKLTNINDREDNPDCTLIQSHQKFE